MNYRLAQHNEQPGFQRFAYRFFAFPQPGGQVPRQLPGKSQLNELETIFHGDITSKRLFVLVIQAQAAVQGLAQFTGGVLLTRQLRYYQPLAVHLLGFVFAAKLLQ